MNADRSEILARFFGAFTSGCRPLLLLDYDGTLAPFQTDRFRAVPWPGVRETLQQIQNQNKTRMAVVTGRPAHEIGSLLGLREPLEVWGLHGFERVYPDGRREQEQLPPKIAAKLDELHGALGRDSFGGLLEAKPNAAVLHWRGASPAQAACIEQRARALFEPAAKIPGFRLLPFDGGIELRAGRDKSAAVETLLAESPAGGPAAYLGDDLTDEAAFRALKGRGLSALVRTEWRETEADLWLRPPKELLDFLERWRAAEEDLG